MGEVAGDVSQQEAQWRVWMVAAQRGDAIAYELLLHALVPSLRGFVTLHRASRVPLLNLLNLRLDESGLNSSRSELSMAQVLAACVQICWAFARPAKTGRATSAARRRTLLPVDIRTAPLDLRPRRTSVPTPLSPFRSKPQAGVGRCR